MRSLPFEAAVLSLLTVLLAPAAARAQLCSDTAPLVASAVPEVPFELAVGEGAVYTSSTAVRAWSPSPLLELDSYGLADTTEGLVASTRDDGAEVALVATGSGIARVLHLHDGKLSAAWTQDLRRSGCTSDTARAAPAIVLRRLATATFQMSYSSDLALFGTAYQSCADGSTAYRTDNRIFALDAETGVVEWAFNVFGNVDVDAIYGLLVDHDQDRVYATSDRTHSSSQHSVWAVSTVNGSLAWSANAGRVQTAPVRVDDRLYVASLSGQVHALDAATGTALWSVGVGAPVEVDPSALRLAATGEVVIAVVDFFGEIHAVRDDGAAGTLLSGFQLPTGAPAAGSPGPAVSAVSPVVADATGRALVGADDGHLYPVDLVAGTVGTPVAVDPTASEVRKVILEPPGQFASPASVLVGTNAGTVARYCTFLVGSPAPVPALPGLLRISLALTLLVSGGTAAARRAKASRATRGGGASNSGPRGRRLRHGDRPAPNDPGSSRSPCSEVPMLRTIAFATLLLLPALKAEAQPCAPNGGTCEVPCFEPGICIDGTCETGQPIVCEQDADVCTVSACNPENGLCETLPTDLACNDGSPCTVYDQCEDGACIGAPVSCDDGDPCTADRCDDSGPGCVFEPIPECGAADVPTITLWPKVLLVLGLVAVAQLASRRSR